MKTYYKKDKKEEDNTKKRYLVLSGNEYGIELDVHNNIEFIHTIEEAEKEYKKNIKEYGCSVMYEVSLNGLKPLKSISNFDGDEEE